MTTDVYVLAYDGFDIWEWRNVLTASSTLDLHILCAEFEAMELLHRRCHWRQEDDPEAHLYMVRLYAHLQRHITQELAYRRNSSLLPHAAN